MKTHHHTFKRSLAILLAVLALVSGMYGICRAVTVSRAYEVTPLTDEQLADLNLTGITHLMIVAHPDDETLWGGAHISDGGYLVVCITNGNNATRAAEFQSVMQASGNAGLILSYPDKVAGKRDDWTHVRKQIQTDLEKVMTYQPWTDIVTHNAKGEYGHIHHKMTHQIVAALYDANQLQEPLYVFGKYYRAAALPDAADSLTAVPDTALEKKEKLLQLYTSQAHTIQNLSHMNPYEMWTQIRGGTADEAAF